MTTSSAKHDALGGGVMRDGMEPNSPLEVVEIDKVTQDYPDIKRTSINGINQLESVVTEQEEPEEGEPSGPLEHAGFWDHSMVNVRLHVIKLWARDGEITTCYQLNFMASRASTDDNSPSVLILFIAIILVLSCFEGVFWHLPANIKNLKVFVVDFDGQVDPYLGGIPLVGPQVVQSTEAISRSDKPHLGYITISPSNFNNDPITVRQAVYDFKAYAAVIVNANATNLLRQAVEQGNSSYDPNGAVQVIYVTARDSATISNYVVPQLVALEKAVVTSFGSSWTRSVVQNSTLSSENLAKAPQAISPAIGFTTIDLRPFGPATMTPWVSIGLIYLIIIAFFSFSFFLPIHLKYIQPRGHPPLHFHQLIIWRWFATVAAYLLFSLSYSAVSVAFQIPMTNPRASQTEPATNPNAYGKGTFLVYWMINFIGMTALGLACENVAMLLGQPWTAIWLIFWVITNVSTGFYSMDLSPGFYKWGYAWPLHHGKSIVFLFFSSTDQTVHPNLALDKQNINW